MRAYHIGYNGACKLPDPLPAVFVWRHDETGTELLTMVEDSYGNMMRIAGDDTALVFQYACLGESG